MERFTTSTKDSSVAAQILKSGSVCLIPTDTVYGLSARATFDKAGDETGRQLALIKGGRAGKHFIRLAYSIEEIETYCALPIPRAIKDRWPGKLTAVLPLKDCFCKSEGETAAFRCPADPWLRKLLLLCGFPIFSTSANRSGCPPITRFSDAVREFGRDVPLIVDGGDLSASCPSTIVRVALTGDIELLRQGEVSVCST